MATKHLIKYGLRIRLRNQNTAVLRKDITEALDSIATEMCGFILAEHPTGITTGLMSDTLEAPIWRMNRELLDHMQVLGLVTRSIYGHGPSGFMWTLTDKGVEWAKRSKYWAQAQVVDAVMDGFEELADAED